MMWIWRAIALVLLLGLLSVYVAAAIVAAYGAVVGAIIEWLERAVETVMARCE